MTGKMKEQDPLVRAKSIVFRMLNIRPRSVQEVRDRLRQKDLPDSDVDRTVQYFKDLDLLDDRVFARQWITSRLRRPFGPHRIRMELKRKGIADDIIETELPAQQEVYPELSAVSGLIEARNRLYKDLDPLKRKRRLVEYLQRRGFSIGVIRKAIDEYDR